MKQILKITRKNLVFENRVCDPKEIVREKGLSGDCLASTRVAKIPFQPATASTSVLII